jgi:hypothetical protein
MPSASFQSLQFSFDYATTFLFFVVKRGRAAVFVNGIFRPVAL